MNKAVEEYIKKELSKGVPIEKIKKALIDVGHDVRDVEKRLRNEEETLLKQTIKKDTNTDRELDYELLKYIHVGMKLGKHMDVISKELLMAGHDINKINRHVEHVKKKEHKGLKLFGIIAGVMMLILFIGFAFYMLMPMTAHLFEPKIPEETIFDPDYEKCVEQCVIDGCEQVCRNDMYLAMAMQEQNSSKCEIITDPDTKQSCRDLLIRRKAVEGRNLDTCNEISQVDMIQYCKNLVLQTQALLYNNQSQCDLITDEFLQTGCVDNFIQSNAINNDNISQCEQISSTDYITRCKDNVIRNRAFTNSDPALCDEITDENMKINCKTRFTR